MPARVLSRTEMVELLYHRKQRFKRGKIAAQAIAESESARQQKVKTALIAGQQTLPLGDLMIRHFREVMDETGFYSTPAHLLKRAPIQTLGHALTTSLSIGGATGAFRIADAESVKPLMDCDTSQLCIADRRRPLVRAGTILHSTPGYSKVLIECFEVGGTCSYEP